MKAALIALVVTLGLVACGGESHTDLVKHLCAGDSDEATCISIYSLASDDQIRDLIKLGDEREKAKEKR